MQDYARVGSVKYRSRAIDKPLVVYEVQMTIMMTIERAKGRKEDATDLSAKYRGCTGLPISVYGQEPGWVNFAPVPSRGTSAYFGM